MKTTMRVEGLREVDRALGELPKAVARNALRAEAIASLKPTADLMRQIAPDDPATGGYDLRGSITVGTKLSPRQARMNRRAIRVGDKDKSFVEAYAGAGPLPQAHLTEFGTVNMAPQPWARPAWEQTKGGILPGLAKRLWDRIDRAAKRVAARAAKKAG